MDQPNSSPTPPQAPKPEDLVYNVMPSQDGKNFAVGFDKAGNPVPPSLASSSLPSGSKKWWYIIIGIIVLLILGGLAYYLLGTNNTATPVEQVQPASRLPQPWLTQNFNTPSCTDQTTCSENADPDNDGLSNYSEFKADTIPLNPDTDSDGIADGDEVNIYKTDPKLKYTDRREIVATNNWTDGFQIKGGYDPVTGLKMTETRNQQIVADTATFRLHAPTTATLALTTSTNPPDPDTATKPSAPQTVKVTILNNTFSPATITINKGDTVVWTNKDTVAHTVTSDTSAFGSPDLALNKDYSFTFQSAGTFAYHCTIHPNMKATVVVK